MISHHPSDDSLAHYAAGNLGAGPRLVLATHLSGCPQCRARVRSFEAVGGALIDSCAPADLPADGLERVFRLIDAPEPIRPVAPVALHPELPEPLRRYPVGRWRFVHPGFRWRRVTLPEAPDANVIMLRVGAGQKVPQHTHTGTEYTQVLTGAFSDPSAAIARAIVSRRTRMSITSRSSIPTANASAWRRWTDGCASTAGSAGCCNR